MSACIWLTGLPGSGKSTLARALAEALRAPVCVLDGDELRRGLCQDLGFSPEDRRENLRRAASVARLLVDSEVYAIVALIAPYGADRALARSMFSPGSYLECYVSCPVEVCRARDPKGMYARAERGEIAGFTGVSAPYEPPTAPELVVYTDRDGVDACVDAIVSALRVS